MVRNVLKKGVALLLVLVFLTALCVVAVKPAFSSGVPVGDSWAIKAPMPMQIHTPKAAELNGKIYVVGSRHWGDMNNSLFEYDPLTDKWTVRKPMPCSTSYFAVAACNGKIYVIGGGLNPQETDAISNNEVYDPATDSWETRASMPTRRYGMDANVVEGKIYVIGGNNAAGGVDGVNEVYDPLTDTWETKARIPIRVSFYASAVVDNKIYVIGGFNGFVYGDLNQIYDPEADTWSNGAHIPISPLVGPRAGATTGVWAPKRIFIIGTSPPYGLTDQGGNVIVVNNVPNQIYDPEQDAWSIGATLPIPKISFGVAVVDDIFYAIGGHNSLILYMQSLTNNQQYTPNEYGTIAPVVSVVSPENKNYTSNNISLAFKVNKPAPWVGYSIDGQYNVTVTGNTTLPILTSGSHTIKVYAKDMFENTGASETITFIIVDPFPTMLVAAIAGASAAAAGVGLLVYFKKRKQ